MDLLHIYILMDTIMDKDDMRSNSKMVQFSGKIASGGGVEGRGVNKFEEGGRRSFFTQQTIE